MNSRRNNPQSPIAKVDLWLLEPQNITFGSKTSNFKTETFDSNDLHLSPPNLVFKILQKRAWYAGIPINILVFASNPRAQIITNAYFDISILSNNRLIFSQQSTVFPIIKSQHSVTFPFRFIPPEPTNNCSITVKFNYMSEGQLLTTSLQINIQVFHSILCKSSYQEGFIGYAVENIFPFPISSVRFSKGEIVADKLLVNEKVNGFVDKSTAFEVKWSLPFANDCSLIFPPIQKNAEKRKTISIHFLTDGEPIPGNTNKLNPKQVQPKYLPKILSIMTPFEATIRLKNKINEKVSGTLSLSNEESLAILGEDSIRFQLDPKETKLINITFIGLKEGTIQFPNFIANFDDIEKKDSNMHNSLYPNKISQDSNTQDIQVKSGIILVGNNN